MPLAVRPMKATRPALGATRHRLPNCPSAPATNMCMVAVSMDMQVPNNPGNRVVSLASKFIFRRAFELPCLARCLVCSRRTTTMTHMNLAQSIAVLTLLALPLVTSAQKRDKTEGDDKSNRSGPSSQRKVASRGLPRHHGCKTRRQPRICARRAVVWLRVDLHEARPLGAFDGGLDLGLQPIGTRTFPTPLVDANGRLCRTDVTLRNQLVRRPLRAPHDALQNPVSSPLLKAFWGSWRHGHQRFCTR